MLAVDKRRYSVKTDKKKVGFGHRPRRPRRSRRSRKRPCQACQGKRTQIRNRRTDIKNVQRASEMEDEDAGRWACVIRSTTWHCVRSVHTLLKSIRAARRHSIDSRAKCKTGKDREKKRRKRERAYWWRNIDKKTPRPVTTTTTGRRTGQVAVKEADSTEKENGRRKEAAGAATNRHQKQPKSSESNSARRNRNEARPVCISLIIFEARTD